MKVVLTIAGSDSSGGAGIQADLKTFEAFGVFGTSVITVLTAQNTTGVRAVSEVAPEFIAEQLAAVQEDFEIAAVKVGMLYSVPIIKTVASFLSTCKAPVVIDPVGISKAGSPLLREDAFDALQTLFPYATLLTPNRYEAHRLFGYEFGDTQSLEGIINAPCPVLVKNETLAHGTMQQSIDQLFTGHQRRIFSSSKVPTANLHGTGCSYSSAIAASLALGFDLEDAVSRSKHFIFEALTAAPAIGHGPGPINHRHGGLRVC